MNWQEEHGGADRATQPPSAAEAKFLDSLRVLCAVRGKTEAERLKQSQVNPYLSTRTIPETDQQKEFGKQTERNAHGIKFAQFERCAVV